VAFPEVFDSFGAGRFSVRGFPCSISFSSSSLETERRTSSRRMKAIDSGDGRVGPVSISGVEATLRPPGEGTWPCNFMPCMTAVVHGFRDPSRSTRGCLANPAVGFAIFPAPASA
jgi:hypothetical protein